MHLPDDAFTPSTCTLKFMPLHFFRIQPVKERDSIFHGKLTVSEVWEIFKVVSHPSALNLIACAKTKSSTFVPIFLHFHKLPYLILRVSTHIEGFKVRPYSTTALLASFSQSLGSWRLSKPKRPFCLVCLERCAKPLQLPCSFPIILD